MKHQGYFEPVKHNGGQPHPSLMSPLEIQERVVGDMRKMSIPRYPPGSARLHPGGLAIVGNHDEPEMVFGIDYGKPDIFGDVIVRGALKIPPSFSFRTNDLAEKLKSFNTGKIYAIDNELNIAEITPNYMDAFNAMSAQINRANFQPNTYRVKLKFCKLRKYLRELRKQNRKSKSTFKK